jgi:hypothetical protein
MSAAAAAASKAGPGNTDLSRFETGHRTAGFAQIRTPHGATRRARKKNGNLGLNMWQTGMKFNF